MKSGAAGYFTKPFATDELRLRVRRLAAQREAERRAGSNKAAAARLLGITRRRLYSRLESLGLRRAADEDDG